MLGPSWLPRSPSLGTADRCPNVNATGIQIAVSASSLATLVLDTRGADNGLSFRVISSRLNGSWFANYRRKAARLRTWQPGLSVQLMA
eukprot:4389465-Prorocentrum_lima.AAC.1